MQLVKHIRQKIWSIYIQHFGKFLFERLRRLYFQEYNLEAVFLLNFFPRFKQFTGFGFCYTASTLAMLAFRGIPSSRIVRGLVGADKYWHSWLEFQYLGVRWVLDPCQCDPFAIPRRQFYAEYAPEIQNVITHEEFWSCPFFRQVYDKMSDPETSHVFFEIYSVSTPSVLSQYDFDHGVIASLNNLSHHGIYSMPFPEDSGIIFSQRIFDQYMKKTTRTLPKKRAIRQALALRRRVFQEIANLQSNLSANT